MGTEPRLIHIARNLKGESTFTLHRLEQTHEGKECFFPSYIDKIRNVEMRGLLKVLDPSSKFSESDIDADELERVMKSGCLKKEGGKYTWHRGVFLNDLVKRLQH